jgi:hypothetical protein
MAFKSILVGVVASLALVGCVETTGFGGSGGSGGGFGGSGGSGGGGGFGGSGGSGSSSLSLGRDVCLRTAREQGLNVARVDSVEEYSFGNNPPRGVEVRMQVRRDAMTVNTEPRTCRFLYSNGTADISRT